VLRRARDLAYDPDSGFYGAEADHGSSPLKCLEQVSGWVEVAEHLLRKTPDDASAVELPGKLDAPLDEIATWLVHFADATAQETGGQLPAASLPTVAAATPSRPITIGGPGESGSATIGW
jgi:hypothetical protein